MNISYKTYLDIEKAVGEDKAQYVMELLNAENIWIEEDESKDKERLEELRESAMARYLDKTDWDISDWLSRKEWVEYNKLEKQLN